MYVRGSVWSFSIRNYDKREHVFSGRGSLLNHLRIENSALSIT